MLFLFDHKKLSITEHQHLVLEMKEVAEPKPKKAKQSKAKPLGSLFTEIKT